jgi:hypothetical protein
MHDASGKIVLIFNFITQVLDRQLEKATNVAISRISVVIDAFKQSLFSLRILLKLTCRDLKKCQLPGLCPGPLTQGGARPYPDPPLVTRRLPAARIIFWTPSYKNPATPLGLRHCIAGLLTGA